MFPFQQFHLRYLGSLDQLTTAKIWLFVHDLIFIEIPMYASSSNIPKNRELSSGKPGRNVVKKSCHNSLITFAILNMNKYERYLINFQSELLKNALLHDPVIFLTMKFNKIEREWRRASKITSWGKIEANSPKHAIPPCRLANGEFKSVFGNHFRCGEGWRETKLWACAENHKYDHEIDM